MDGWHDDNQRLCLSFSRMTCMAMDVMYRNMSVPMVGSLCIVYMYVRTLYDVCLASTCSAAHRSRQPDSDRGYVPDLVALAS